MDSQRVIVWTRSIIGPFFYENEERQALTVNGEHYRTILHDFLWPELEAIDLDRIWFQQDGTMCYTARETMALFQTKFEDRILSRNGNVNWPPRSCDLMPPDYLL